MCRLCRERRVCSMVRATRDFVSLINFFTHSFSVLTNLKMMVPFAILTLRIDSILCWRNAEDSAAPGAPPPGRGAEVRPWATRCALLNMSTRYIGQWSPSGAPVAPRCTTHWFLVPTHCSGSWDPWYPTTGVSHSLAFILVHFLRYWRPPHSLWFFLDNQQPGHHQPRPLSGSSLCVPPWFQTS